MRDRIAFLHALIVPLAEQYVLARRVMADEHGADRETAAVIAELRLLKSPLHPFPVVHAHDIFLFLG
jgi:hypothetical protein